MKRKERISLIQEIEKKRNSKVIIYITSDRRPSEFCTGSIALDVIPLFYEQLKGIGKVRKISLCIQSLGGNLDTPWPLVNLIREYCQEFEVIVLNKALSAATLIALGANRIVMSPIGQLSPIDPRNTYSIKDGKKISLEVEDIISFINLAKEKVGIKSQPALSEILKSLVGDVPTHILGSVNRTHSLIRRLSLNLLKLHFKGKNKEKQCDHIVEQLTEKLFSHQHYINRKEAKELIGFGDIIEYPENELEDIIDKIASTYNRDLEITKPFEPLNILRKKDKMKYIARRAIIESIGKTNTFESHLEISKIPAEPVPQVNIKVTFQGWQ